MPARFRPTRFRIVLTMMPLGLLALAAAAWAGLSRIGWAWPVPAAHLLLGHGPLMISGFLGTVIGIERAVAWGRPWGYTAPLTSALGVVALLLGREPVARLCFITASAVLTALYVAGYRRQPAMFTAVMGLGAAAWMTGNLLHDGGWPLFAAVPWWMAFLVLTIVGERLELSRVRPPSRSRQSLFLAVIVVYLAGLGLSLFRYDAGIRLTGLAFVGLAGWLGHYDVARTTVKGSGLTRFMAIALLAGYVWLAVAGVLFAAGGGHQGGVVYDAQLHAVFIGFVFSMIFAHAPIILPAVAGIRVEFRHRFYGHLALLHFSLLVRVAGDLAGLPPVRLWGAVLNVAAILLFIVSTVAATARAGARARDEAGLLSSTG